MGLVGNSAPLKIYSTIFWMPWFSDMAIFALFCAETKQHRAKMAMSENQGIQKIVE